MLAKLRHALSTPQSAARLVGLPLLVLAVGLGVWFFFLRGGANVVPAGPPQRPAVGTTVTVTTYRAAIQDAYTAFQEALDAEGAARDAALADAKSALESVEGASIVLAEGGVGIAQADNTLILEEMARDDPNLEAIEGSLAFLLEALDNGPTGHTGQVEGTLAGDAALAELSRVLSDPVYDYTSTQSPLSELARWLANLTGSNDPDSVLLRLLLSLAVGLAVGAVLFLSLDKWVPNRWARLGIAALGTLITTAVFFVASDNLDVVMQVFAAVGIAVAVGAVALILLALNRGSAPSSVRPVSDLASVLGMSAAEARARAAEAAGEADYRSAIRYRCLAVLLALDEAGMLVFDRSATNREYLFRAPGPLHDELQLLLSRFEAVWYGNSPTGAEEWQQYTARAAEVETQIKPTREQKAA